MLLRNDDKFESRIIVLNNIYINSSSNITFFVTASVAHAGEPRIEGE